MTRIRDKEKGQELERLSERQLFRDYSGLDLSCSIRRPQCLVNDKTAGQSGYSPRSVFHAFHPAKEPNTFRSRWEEWANQLAT